MSRYPRITAEQEAAILAALEVTSHASLVARQRGVSFPTAWRVADRHGIPLTAGREAKGYKRLSPERREAVIEARRANPEAAQIEIARAAGVSRSTVWRIERGRRGGLSPSDPG